MRNTLGKTLWMYGLGAKRGVAGDSVGIAPGASHEFRFRPDAAGLFYYAGRTTAPAIAARLLDDSQLQGVIAVDSAGAPPDRIFLISNWAVFPDTTTVSGVGPNFQLSFNGLSWPHTERLDLVQGDSVHWRFVNVSVLAASAAPARLLLSRRLARRRRARQHDCARRPPAHGDRAREPR